MTDQMIYDKTIYATPTLPEAPCSISMRVPIPGYTDHPQITGRGQTGAEAAAQWQAARDALLALLAPPPTPTREEQLARLLTCGVTKATARGDFALVERLTKAYTIVARGMVEPTAVEGAWAVRSSADVETWYESDGQRCTCPDAKKHQDDTHYRCKHAISVLYFIRLQGITPYPA